MDHNYTETIESSIFDYGLLDDETDKNAVIAFLKDPNSFRSFSDGLKTLLEDIGFSGSDDEMVKYIYDHLKATGIKMDKKTITSWVNGQSRPKIEPKSRPKMYQLCFALKLSWQQTKWFFHHVYYDRAFNVRKIDEAVYYYAFKNQIDFQTANSIIQEVEEAPQPDVSDEDTTNNFTFAMQKRLDNIGSTAELREFLIRNKPQLSVWNQTAYRYLHQMKQSFIGDKNNKHAIEQFKNKLRKAMDDTKYHNCLDVDIGFPDFSPDYSDGYGLIYREILYDAKSNSEPLHQVDYVLYKIDDQDLYSNDNILKMIIGTYSGIPKTSDLPDHIRTNFPSKIVLSELLGQNKQNDTDTVSSKKIDRVETYDKIRKLIVLFNFYSFWVNYKLKGKDPKLDGEKYYNIYVDEANERLDECGYEPLFAGNPYDWIFLHCANSVIDEESPVDYFRQMIKYLCPELFQDLFPELFDNK